MRTPMVAGNWKMNGLDGALAELVTLSDVQTDIDVVICPPATLISRASDVVGESDVRIGAQDCHANENGAHTGEVSADMLTDAGAEFVILGHSERRADQNETSQMVYAKTNAAWNAGLTAIVCVGETLEQREAANTLDIVGGQMDASIPEMATGENLVVAYEPVWAIGTGKVPTLDQIGEVHDFIRTRLERRFGETVGRSVRVLYGGSMNPKNAADIISVSNVDGGLIGGASLKAADFSQIIAAIDA